MSDDIVTRLRRKQHNDKELWCNSCEEFCCHCEICECCMEILDITDDAADEIERLRADRYRWLNIAFCTHCLPQHDHYCAEHSQDEDGNG